MQTMETEKICRNCEYWTQFMFNEKYECLLMRSSGGKADYPESKAVALDGEDYLAGVITQPDFGCIQFKEKPAQNEH